jgi:hypothetical protein
MDRRMRAMFLTLSEYVRGAPTPIRKPTSIFLNEMWLCEPNEYDDKRLCYMTNLPISNSTNKNKDYICIKCNMIFFECKTCWDDRNKRYHSTPMGDFMERCDRCYVLILICRGCINDLYTSKGRRVEDDYQCGVCESIRCSKDSVPSDCMGRGCDRSVVVCHSLMTHDHYDEYCTCHACGH